MFRRVSLVLLSIWVFISCGGDSASRTIDPNLPKGSFYMTVETPAGTSWSEKQRFIPAPFNVGSLDEHKVLLMSDTRKKGTDIPVYPIAVVKVKEADSTKHYICAIPAEVSQRTNGIHDFSDFTTSYSSSKWIIEQYILSRNGIGQASLIGWEEGDFVQTVLQAREK